MLQPQWERPGQNGLPELEAVKYSQICLWHWQASICHRENGGTQGMVPLIITPKKTLYDGHLLGIFPINLEVFAGAAWNDREACLFYWEHDLL